jgi:HK97 family phage major capsid protein
MDLSEISAMLTEQKQAAQAARDAHTTELNNLKGRLQSIDTVIEKRGTEGVEEKQAFQDQVEKLTRLEGDVQQASDALARMTQGSPSDAKSIADLLEEKAAEMAQYRGGNLTLLDNVNTKAITSGAASAGALIVPMQEMTPIMAPQQMLWLRNLINAVPISTDSLTYRKELARTNNAAIQAAEGDTKAESTITFEAKTEAVQTIAHWATHSRQVMQDVPQLQGILNEMLTYGLNVAEQVQMLLGSGTGSNLNGIMPQASAYVTSSEIATDTRIDRIRRAMLQAEDALYPASAIAMNHRDWAEIEMTKTDDKAYLFANPVNGTAPRLWGLPVLSAPSIALNEFVTGGFSTGATIYDREQTTVRVADQDGTDFVQNMMKILVEKRVMIAVKRPASFIKGNFTFS